MGIRQSLLFTGPNALSALVFWLIIDFLIINRNKKNIFSKSILALIPLIICFLFTKTRTTILLYFLYLILLLLIKSNIGKKIINFLNFYISDILFMFSSFIVVFSDYIIIHFRPIFDVVNKMFWT